MNERRPMGSNFDMEEVYSDDDRSGGQVHGAFLRVDPQRVLIYNVSR